MPKLMGKMNKRLVTSAGSDIRIEESASFAGGSLYVVSARGKTLLLSVNAQGVQCLSDLSEARPEPLAPTFGELVEAQLQRTTQESEPAGPTADPEPEDGVTAALRRLERLAS
jgi:flagellar biogenesis protein FliO